VSGPKLSIRDLGKTFSGAGTPVTALAGVDLDLADNEFVSLVGTSGCGKSTLLSIVAGLETHDAGSVTIDGRPLAGPGRDRGVVFQSYTLFPWLTARQNVEFALRTGGRPAAEIRAVAAEHLALVGLTGFADAFPAQLSGGMKQRVAIARALAYRPRMLLMDEPFGALDALTRHHMQELLARIWERHRLTVLFVTHDVEEAVYMSDRVAVMSNRPGRIKTIVPVDLPRPRRYDMVASPAFAALQHRVLDEIRAESIAIAALGDALS
jgi:NitT/TauT family transport system ATP-binding protein